MNKEKVKLLLIFIPAIIIRLYHVTYPIADWHSHRQADTASVTRNIANGTGTFLTPTYHDLSNVQSGLNNPHGYRMVEIPIYNQITASIYSLFQKISTLEVMGRLVNIFFWSLSGIFIYFISRELFNKKAAYWSAVVFMYLPFGVYYSRTILPEPTGVLFMTASIYFLLKEKLLPSSISFGLAVLIKPYVALLLLPIVAYRFLKSNKKLQFVVLYILCGLLPFLIWRQWIAQFPEGIPTYKWLFQQGFSGENFVVGRPYWFRWLFYERISLLIAGFGLVIPLLLGLKNKINILFFSGVILYFCIIARGNVQHDYYQVLILPLLALIIGMGASKLPSYLVFVLTILAIIISGDKIKEYYKINNPSIVAAGQTADSLLPKNALVIAPYNGDTAFLYATNRSGWPIPLYDDLEKQINSHSEPIYYVSVNYDDYTNSILKTYPALTQNSQYVIVKIK